MANHSINTIMECSNLMDKIQSLGLVCYYIEPMAFHHYTHWVFELGYTDDRIAVVWYPEVRTFEEFIGYLGLLVFSNGHHPKSRAGVFHHRMMENINYKHKPYLDSIIDDYLYISEEAGYGFHEE